MSDFEFIVMAVAVSIIAIVSGLMVWLWIFTYVDRRQAILEQQRRDKYFNAYLNEIIKKGTKHD